jgi:hypothetical protein
MATWRLQRFQDGVWIDTGEVYDDTWASIHDEAGTLGPALSLEDYLAYRLAVDGWTYQGFIDPPDPVILLEGESNLAAEAPE